MDNSIKDLSHFRYGICRCGSVSLKLGALSLSFERDAFDEFVASLGLFKDALNAREKQKAKALKLVQ